MDMNYVMIHLGWTEETKELTEAEKGRLIDAIVAYAADGSLPENLRGGERYLFPVYRAQVDRDRSAYDQKIKALRENGSKGGRPRKAELSDENLKKQMVSDENLKKQMVFSESKKTQGKGECKGEGECKGYGKGEDDSPLCPPSELIRTQEEHNAVFDAWESAGFPTSEIIRGKLVDLYAQHGKDKLLEAITVCGLASPRQPMQYLAGVLKNDGKPKPVTTCCVPPQKVNPAAKFPQRDWANDDGSDDMERFMAGDWKL